MANVVTFSGVVVSSISENFTKSRTKFLSFRVKNETLKGSLRETVHARVNVYSAGQQRLLRLKKLQTGDRVWVKGELMSRMADPSGQDLLEIRGLEVDPVILLDGGNAEEEVYDG